MEREAREDAENAKAEAARKKANALSRIGQLKEQAAVAKKIACTKLFASLLEASSSSSSSSKKAQAPGPENQPWVKPRPDCDNNFMPISLYDHIKKPAHHKTLGAGPDKYAGDPTLDLLRESAAPLVRRDKDFDQVVPGSASFAKRRR